MRAREFLLEYNRQKTAQMMGQQLVNAFRSGPDRQQYLFYDTTFQTPDGQPNTQVILDHLLKNFEEADPTKNKIYTPWIAREYAKGNIARLEDVHAWLPQMLANYDQYKKRSDFRSDAKDIMRLSWAQLFTIMDNYEPRVELTDKGKSKQIYSDSNVRIIVPEDQQAACYYGQGTRWCTAATKGQNFFDHYNRQSPLYVLLPTKPNYDGEKYQLHFGSNQFMDEEDSPVDLSELLIHRFPGLLEFFEKEEPQIRNFVIFAPDDILQKIGDQIKEHAKQYMLEKITEWEIDDYNYREWQYETALRKGLVDPDTMSEDEIWDKIHEVDELNNYLEFDDVARRWYEQGLNAVDLNPGLLREIASEMQTEGYDDSYDLIPYQGLGEVYKYQTENEFETYMNRNRNSDHGLAEFLDSLAIDANGNVKQITGKYRDR